MLRSLLLAIFLIASGVDPQCAYAQAGIVAGTVTWQQRFALPADALLEVRLEDTSRADAAASTIAKVAFPAAGKSVPIPFRIDFDPAGIDPAHRYAVRATITSGGNLLYTSTRVHPVLTQGTGNEAAVEVYLLLPAAVDARPAAGSEPTKSDPVR